MAHLKKNAAGHLLKGSDGHLVKNCCACPYCDSDSCAPNLEIVFSGVTSCYACLNADFGSGLGWYKMTHSLNATHTLEWVRFEETGTDYCIWEATVTDGCSWQEYTDDTCTTTTGSPILYDLLITLKLYEQSSTCGVGDENIFLTVTAVDYFSAAYNVFFSGTDCEQTPFDCDTEWPTVSNDKASGDCGGFLVGTAEAYGGSATISSA